MGEELGATKCIVVCHTRTPFIPQDTLTINRRREKIVMSWNCRADQFPLWPSHSFSYLKFHVPHSNAPLLTSHWSRCCPVPFHLAQPCACCPVLILATPYSDGSVRCYSRCGRGVIALAARVWLCCQLAGRLRCDHWTRKHIEGKKGDTLSGFTSLCFVLALCLREVIIW